VAEALPAPKIGGQDGRGLIVEAYLPSSLPWAAACERRRRTSDTSSSDPNGSPAADRDGGRFGAVARDEQEKR
jgi:hypothetical protein